MRQKTAKKSVNFFGRRYKAFTLAVADAAQDQVSALITHHQTQALAANSVCEGHALDPSAYDRPGLTLYAAKNPAGHVLGICGLQVETKQYGELKTLHTRREARGQGVGEALVAHVIAQARAQDLPELVLETGTAPFFQAASRLYVRLGFVECGPFGSYAANPDSHFMRLDLRSCRW